MMVREKTYEIISEFQTIKIDDELCSSSKNDKPLYTDIDISNEYVNLVEK